MEMNYSVFGMHNLLEQTEKSLDEISCWSWPELLVTLKHCQDLSLVANSPAMLEKCLDSLVARLSLTIGASPCTSTSPPDSSTYRFSCSTRSSESLKYSLSRANCWFEDLAVLSPALVEIVMKSMVSRKYDHGIISRFLFFYHQNLTLPQPVRKRILEIVIDMLDVLDLRSISCKSLFGILPVVLRLSISKCSRKKL